MICGFKECLISLEERPAPSGASCSPHGSVPLPLPAAGILETQTLSEECGVAPTLSVTMRRPFDNLSGTCPGVLQTLLFTWVSFFPPCPALSSLVKLCGVTASGPAPPQPQTSL